VGFQNWADGSPIMVKTTKKGYDQFYTGSDGGDTYIYHLYIDSVIRQVESVSIDLGNDETAEYGNPNIKFYPMFPCNQNNDAPLFRYSDIL
jgi:hypothetical protein